MLGATIIEVAIGLIFVYMLMSLVCSAINEVLSQIFKTRARTLEKGIERLLTDKNTREKFYSHPLVQSLCSKNSKKEKRKPSYISSRVFALALLDTVAPNDPKSADRDFAKLREEIGKIQIPDLQKALLSLFDAAEGKLETARKNVEDWYDDAMDRVSGWYKRKSQWVLLIAGFILACVLNADTLDFTLSLWRNPELRHEMTVAADRFIAEANKKDVPKKPEDLKKAVSQLQEQLNKVEQIPLPLGWSKSTLPKGAQWILKFIGLALTALAVSLGAPFWFDLLNKITRVRISGQVPKKASNKTS